MMTVDPSRFSVFSVSPGEEKTLCVVGDQITLEERGKEDREAGAILESSATVQHGNLSEEEWVYMLEGELTFQLGDRAVTLQQGGYLLAPHGMSHAVLNEGETVARMLVIVSPSGFRE